MNNLVAAAAAMEESMKGGDGTDAKIGLTAAIKSCNDDASSGKREAPSSSSKEIPAAKARRLEQNRRAAIESRRRKKVLMEELKRSVAFYTKSNATIAQHNRELEHRLILAKQRLNEMGLSTATAAPATSTSASSTGDHEMNLNHSIGGEDSKSIQENHVQELEVEPVSHVAIETSQMQDYAKQPQETPCPPVNPEPLPIATQQVSSSSTENEKQSEEDEYINALKKFAAQQSAIASAAAASANAAYQAIKYHEMMKKNGHEGVVSPRFPLSQFHSCKDS